MKRTSKKYLSNPFLLTMERLHHASQLMDAEEKQALAEWEKINLGDGKTGTSDWPGWAPIVKRLSH